MQCEGRICHGDIDILAFSCLRAMNNGRKNAHHGVARAPCNIGDLNIYRDRACCFATVVSQNTRNGEVVHVMTGSVFVGAGLAVARD